MSWPEIEAIVYGDTSSPQTILGRHYSTGYTMYQMFMPSADSVNVVFADDKKKIKMELADEAGFFAGAILGKDIRNYSYEVTYKDGTKKNIIDPYMFNPVLSSSEVLSWNKGTSLHAYKYMGAQICDIDGISGIRFRVWAPNATRVSVVGDFNNWDGSVHPMILDENTGVFSLFVPGISAASYRYEILSKGGEVCQKRDPYASDYDSNNDCSVVKIVDEYVWNDNDYLKSKCNASKEDAILNIFEVDSTLWFDIKNTFKKSDVTGLCKYVSEVGYSHILINISDDNFYCINKKIDRNVLKNLVDSMHALNVAVLIKWNPCFFNPDESGLKVFDGTYLYGHLDERKRYNAMFGYNFNYGREQINDFLVSNLVYWVEEFHIDGIHIDEISTVLRLDYGRSGDDFAANIYGGNENLEAISFIKNVNSILHTKYPGCISMTKETTMYPKVTYSIKDDGLGFDYIWDNGFGEDYLEFIKSDNVNINKLTDSMAYAYSENYILTLSKEDVIAANDYDAECVLEGAGYFDSFQVEDEHKLAMKRATLGFFMAHPGKKLIYMGQDDKVLSSKLNELYKKLPSFSELDRYKEGFEWVSAFNNGTGVISFVRKSELFCDNVLVVCNFSYNEYADFKLAVPYEGKYRCFLCTEDKLYGGSFKIPAKAIASVDEEYDGKDCTIILKIPPMSVSYYSYEPYSEEEFEKIAKRKAAAIKKELEMEALRKEKELLAEAKRKAKEYNNLVKKQK